MRANLWPLFESGKLRPPPVHARFPLTAAAEAHALMESGEHIGKIVLTAA
jgi:NADPH2:quinone reductase